MERRREGQRNGIRTSLERMERRAKMGNTLVNKIITITRNMTRMKTNSIVLLLVKRWKRD